MAFYMIDDEQIGRLRRLMLRLYSERRLHGDEYRDNAQMIDSVLRVVQQSPVPDDEEEMKR
jgi:hypothetical protein